MVTKREEKAETNFYGKKQKKPLKWENLLTKCSNCGSTDMEQLNMYQGMFAKGKGDNYRLHRCKNCKKEFWEKL